MDKSINNNNNNNNNNIICICNYSDSNSFNVGVFSPNNPLEWKVGSADEDIQDMANTSRYNWEECDIINCAEFDQLFSPNYSVMNQNLYSWRKSTAKIIQELSCICMEIVAENARLKKQFRLGFKGSRSKIKKPVYSVKYYFTELKTLYEKKPGVRSTKIICKIARLIKKLLLKNNTLIYPFIFTIVQEKRR